MYFTEFQTQFCPIILVGNQDGLTNLELRTGEGKRQFELGKNWVRHDEFFAETKAQVLQYFSGERKTFNLKLNPKGTDFQQRVWNELAKIPFGETRSYKDLAIAIGKPKSSRAIGMANSKNPIPLIFPCHRVVGTNGSLTGFAHGLNIKRRLLDFERTRINS